MEKDNEKIIYATVYENKQSKQKLICVPKKNKKIVAGDRVKVVKLKVNVIDPEDGK